MRIKDKKLIVFDLDGTLAESKMIMDNEMSALLVKLLQRRPVAVIGGGAFYKFKEQFIDSFQCPEELKSRLSLFPTSGSRFYQYKDGWKEIYADLMTQEERAKIKSAFGEAFKEIGYEHPETIYGEIIEDRGTQITFSALGQQAPLEKKKHWRGSSKDRRNELKAVLEKFLPEFQIQVPSYTSIDVTKKGIHKGYGLRQMERYLGVKISDMVFVGDALKKGGNDYPVLQEGVEALEVSGPQNTKEIIRGWLKEFNN